MQLELLLTNEKRNWGGGVAWLTFRVSTTRNPYGFRVQRTVTMGFLIPNCSL